MNIAINRHGPRATAAQSDSQHTEPARERESYQAQGP
jgi:hypothetical protein